MHSGSIWAPTQGAFIEREKTRKEREEQEEERRGEVQSADVMQESAQTDCDARRAGDIKNSSLSVTKDKFITVGDKRQIRQ